MKVFFPCCLVFFLAVSQSALIREDDAATGRFLIEPLIKAILESLRPKFANIVIPDIDEKINEKNVNVSIEVRDIIIKDVDKFKIPFLKSTVIPLRITNLTLTWDEINAFASYDIYASIRFSENNAPINLFAKGNARANLKKAFLTIGANMEIKNDAVQIKKRGLFGFNARLERSDVYISSLMGSEEFGAIVGNFLSRNIPGLVDDLKNPLFNAFQDNIIDVINQVLKKNGTKSLNERENTEQGRVAVEKLHPIFENEYDLSEESEESEE